MTYSYSPDHAHIYSQLGISGTTYEISFNEVSKLLINHMHGKTALDFGTGTGRSARFLKSLGAARVIGVDHDENMIKQAQASHEATIEFHLIDQQTMPLPDESVDIVMSAHVLVEMRTLHEMQQALKEIARILKAQGMLVVISTNPASLGHEFKSYVYPAKAAVKSGDLITCVLKGTEPFEIDDTYWTEEDYRHVFASAGFSNIQAIFPLGAGEQWLDETIVAPDIVFICSKEASPAST
ncbi:MAG TPA: class I SAM-dependent methyltransferase [Ktedonobacteraceae bacterium]